VGLLFYGWGREKKKTFFGGAAKFYPVQRKKKNEHFHGGGRKKKGPFKVFSKKPHYRAFLKKKKNFFVGPFFFFGWGKGGGAEFFKNFPLAFLDFAVFLKREKKIFWDSGILGPGAFFKRGWGFFYFSKNPFFFFNPGWGQPGILFFPKKGFGVIKNPGGKGGNFKTLGEGFFFFFRFGFPQKNRLCFFKKTKRFFFLGAQLAA